MNGLTRILGAGPAGLTAAIVLAQNGRRVAIYERRPGVGLRFNEDYQGLENWSVEQDALSELEEEGLKINFFCKPFSSGRIYNPALVPLEVCSPRTLFYMVKRGRGADTLDTGLQRQALDAGVEFYYNQTISPREADIVATGPRGVNALAAGITFETDLRDCAYGIVGDHLAPKGYTYLLVADGKATLATVLFSSFSKASLCLERAIHTYGRLLGLTITNPRRWGGYGNFDVPQTAIMDGRLLVGEAAGFQDFLFGFGIRLAMLSGILAAKSILYSENYDILWKRRLLPLLKVSRVNRLLYTRLGNIAYNFLWLLVCKSHRPDRIMRLLYTWGNHEIPNHRL